jgi:hypothetical protein
MVWTEIRSGIGPRARLQEYGNTMGEPVAGSINGQSSPLVTRAPDPFRGAGIMRNALLTGAVCVAAIVLTLVAKAAPAVRDELALCGWDEVFILATNGSGFATNKVWSWKATESDGLPAHLTNKFGTTDECKAVDGGKKLLIVSSGGGIALVERATKKALFHAWVGNAHSAEMLPGNRVVVAGSRHAQGNCLAVFDLNRSERMVYSEPIDSGHGVVWDESRALLWALGYDQLKTFRLKDWESEQPKLESMATYSLPDRSGHDLVPVPSSNDLLITSGRGVFLFDREQRTFRRHPDLGSKVGVKAVTIHPRTQRLVYVQAEGTNWWAAGFRMMAPAGDVRLPGERLYKARWHPHEF